jgi:hypothetical protein
VVFDVKVTTYREGDEPRWVIDGAPAIAPTTTSGPSNYADVAAAGGATNARRTCGSSR